MVWIALLLNLLASCRIAKFCKKGVNPGPKGLNKKYADKCFFRVVLIFFQSDSSPGVSDKHCQHREVPDAETAHQL